MDGTSYGHGLQRRLTYADLPFAVWDLLIELPPAPQFFSTIVREGEVQAVSIARGNPPSHMPSGSPDYRGAIVWSFKPDSVRSDPSWPIRHASTVLAETLSRRSGESPASAMAHVEELARSAAAPGVIDIDGNRTEALTCVVEDVGYVVTPVESEYPFAAACFGISDKLEFRSNQADLSSFIVMTA